VTGISKSKDCLSRSQVYVTGLVRANIACLTYSQVYVTGTVRQESLLLLTTVT
jgi:hypothetical protein